LKKSAMVSTVEKYALEIEILTLSRGFRAKISRSGAQKGVFSGQYAGSLEEPTFSTESAISRHWIRAAFGPYLPNKRLIPKYRPC
jgi:hypothetical protein